MEISELPKNKKIILFDGVCNFCESSVQFVIKHDKKDIFRFVSLQSQLGNSIIKHIGMNGSKVDSIILYEPIIAYYYKAQAIIQISKYLDGMFSLLRIFSILPNGISNAIYDYVAKNRYKWFGRKETCMKPSLEFQFKFLA